MNKKIYSGLDIGKLIAAVMVVLLHSVETTSIIPAGVKYVLTRFAVPFFFITSGFFFYKGFHKAEDRKKYFLSYQKNILKVFFAWALIIYLPFTINTYMRKYPDISALRLLLLLFRRIIIIGSGPYWYLIALFWAATFLFLCTRIRKGEVLLYVGMIIGIILEVCYACFQGFLSQIQLFALIFKAVYGIWSWEFNFLMFGIPFMGLGWLLAEHNTEWPIGRAACIFVTCTCLRVVEYILPIMNPADFWSSNVISIAFIPQALSFFLMMKAWNPAISTDASVVARQLSSTVYYTHAIFLYEIINPLMNKYTDLPTYMGIMILPKVIVTLVLCVLFYLIIRKINNRRLNILING